MIRAFLVGGAVGAFAAAYLIGWWLSATPEHPCDCDICTLLTRPEFDGASVGGHGYIHTSSDGRVAFTVSTN